MAALKKVYDQNLIEAALQSVLLEPARLFHEYENGIVVVGGNIYELNSVPINFFRRKLENIFQKHMF